MHLVGREVHVDRVGHGAQGSWARRRPLKAQRAPGGEEVAVGGAGVSGRGGAAAAAEHVLAHHELAVVLAHGPRSGAESRIGGVGARCPFPRVSVEPVAGDGGHRVRRAVMGEVVSQEVVPLAVEKGDGLPFGFGGKAHACPVGKGVCFVIADVAHRLGRDRPGGARSR